MAKTLLALLALVAAGSAKWQDQHTYVSSTSGLITNGIKQNLLNNLSAFTDTTFRDQLEKDLNFSDSERVLKQISVPNFNKILSVLKLNPIDCDINKDGSLKDDELKCLNYIWKAYIPADAPASKH